MKTDFIQEIIKFWQKYKERYSLPELPKFLEMVQKIKDLLDLRK